MSKREGMTIQEIDKAKILLANGKTPNAVAKELGRDPKTVRKLEAQPDIAQNIREIKAELADMYEELSKRMLESITDEDIQKINAYQRTIAASAATDKMRLLKNQSTANISIAHRFMQLQDEVDRDRTER